MSENSKGGKSVIIMLGIICIILAAFSIWTAILSIEKDSIIKVKGSEIQALTRQKISFKHGWKPTKPTISLKLIS